jgi:cell division protein FtsW (lipid II flippase)
MEKIKDERLKLKNLQNIRIAFIVQTLGIIGILGYDLVTKGMDGMMDNPLWFVFIVTTVVSAYLSMNVSVDYESEEKDPKKSLKLHLVVLLAICVLSAILLPLIDEFNMINVLLIPGIFFVCGLGPIYYLYRLRLKKEEDAE